MFFIGMPKLAGSGSARDVCDDPIEAKIIKSIDINNDGQPDHITQDVYLEKCKRNEDFISYHLRFVGQPNPQWRPAYISQTGAWVFETAAEELNAPLKKGDLVEASPPDVNTCNGVQGGVGGWPVDRLYCDDDMLKSSHAAIKGRVAGFYVEYDPKTRQTRKLISVDTGGIRKRSFPLEAVASKESIDALEAKLKPIIEKVLRSHKKEVKRRHELLAYADPTYLKEPYRNEFLKIAAILLTATQKEIEKLELDEGGKNLILQKVRTQLGL